MALGKALLKADKMGSAEEKELISAAPKKKSNFVGAMGNFSVQYNMTVLSVALAFMKSHSDEVVESDDLADYPEPVWASKTLLAMVFVGAILGMFSMGYVGDVLGRRTGMLVTLSFVVVGALSSAFLRYVSFALVRLCDAGCPCRLAGGCLFTSSSRPVNSPIADIHAAGET